MRKCLAESNCTGQRPSECLLPFCSRTTVQDLAAARGGGSVGERPEAKGDVDGSVG